MASEFAIRIEEARRMYVAAIGTTSEAAARRYLEEQVNAAKRARAAR